MKIPQRRWWSRVGIGLLLAFGAIQLVPYGRAHVNPPTLGEPAWDSPATRTLAKDACFDCHSNQTTWPFYAHVAPVSWLVQYDVDEGRAVLNFSEWQRPQEEAAEASEKVIERDMPPAIYRLMHAHARLTDADRHRLARGLASTIVASPAGERRRYDVEGGDDR